MSPQYVVSCSCGHRMQFSQEFVGRVVKCTKCWKPMTVRAGQTSSSGLEPVAQEPRREMGRNEVSEYVVTCSCGQQMRVGREHFGKTGKCKKCRKPLTVTPDNVRPLEISGASRSVEKATGGRPEVDIVDDGQESDTTKYVEEMGSNDVHTQLPEEGPSAGTPPVSELPDQGVVQMHQESVPAEWKIGDVILDEYEVTGELGEGGMGTVLKVHHLNWDMDMAVKCPKPEYYRTLAQKENFVRECHAWMDLGLHPHIVTCHYVRVLGGVPRVFAEYVDGGSLKDCIRDRRLYEGGREKALERILDIAIQFAWGLHYAHEKGLIHQDVKPDNVMLTSDGQVKVTDFGLANAQASAVEGSKPPEGQSVLASFGGMTPAYCSPEQADNAARHQAGVPRDQLTKLTRRTDIYSWAVSVLEIFAGDVFWMAGNVAGQALQNYLARRLPDDVIPTMPDPVAALLTRNFEHDPDARPRGMDEVVESLRSIFQNVIGRPHPSKTPTPPTELSDVLNNKALSFLELGYPTEADRLWSEALRIDRCHVETTFNTSFRAWREARITDVEFVRRMEEVCTVHDADLRSTYLLGLAHLHRNDLKAAVEVLEKAEQSGNSAQVRIALAHVKEISPSLARISETESLGILTHDSVCLTSDGRLASVKDLNTIHICNVQSGKCVQTIDATCEPGAPDIARLSPDGSWLLTYNQSSEILKTWNATTGECVRSDEGCKLLPQSLSIGQSGRWFIANESLKLTQREVATGRCVRTFELGFPPTFPTFVCVSEDERWALSSSFASNNNLTVWNVNKGRSERTFSGGSVIFFHCISADGRWALSSSMTGEVKLWELATGQCIQTLDNEGETRIEAGGFSKESNLVLAGNSDGKMRVWKVPSGQCVQTFEGNLSACIHTDVEGQWLISEIVESSRIRFSSVTLDAATRRRLPKHVFSTISDVKLVSELELDFKRLLEDARTALERKHIDVAVERAENAKRLPGRARSPELLDLQSAILRYTKVSRFQDGWLLHTFENHTGTPRVGCFSVDGRWALSGGDDMTLRLWNVDTACCERVLESHSGFVNSACMSADGRWALSGSKDKTLRLWDLATGCCERVFEGHSGSVTSVCMSFDGRWALSASEDESVRLWELATGRHIRSFQGHTQTAYLSGDGSWMLSGSTGHALVLWEVATGRCVRTFGGPQSYPFCLSSDGRWALSGGSDVAMVLWDTATGQPVRSLEGESVSTIFLSADCQWALTGNHKGVVDLWNLETGLRVHSFAGHRKGVTHVCLSADNRWVLSGSQDMCLKVWELDWEPEFPGWTDWDGGARPYLETFIAVHTPYASALPIKDELDEHTVTAALIRKGKPAWNDEDFHNLLYLLSCVGYGWLRPEGVRAELESMVENQFQLTQASTESGLLNTSKLVDRAKTSCIELDARSSDHLLEQSLDTHMPMKWKVGDVILDKYEVTGKLGEGGMGIVLKVHHLNWDMDMAVKCLKSDNFRTQAQKENFVRECHAWMDLGLHPHIVTCHYVRVLGGVPRVFVEFVEGGNLKDWIKDRRLYEGGKERALERILDVAIQFAEGLHYAHEKGLIHQDVKPDNVMLTEDGQVKVTDFGLANAQALTEEGAKPPDGQGIQASFGGMTPAYCSPEQADNAARRQAGVPRDQLTKLTSRTDIYSWAVSILEMFAGEVFWMAGNMAGQALDQYLSNGLPDDNIPTMPGAMSTLLRRCFEHDPEARPSGMHEVAESLQSIRKDTDVRMVAVKALVPSTEESDVRNNKALSLLELGHYAEAERLWCEALQRDPHNRETIFNAFLHAWRQGRMSNDDVVRSMEQLVSCHEKEWHVRYMLGLVHLQFGDGVAAVQTLEKALEISGNRQGISRSLARARELRDSCQCTFEGHKGNVRTVCLSVDGKWALSGGEDATLKLWEIATGECARTFYGHESPVNSVCLSGDRNVALSASADHTIKLWDTETGRCVRTLQGHTSHVYSVCLGADGRWALSGSSDKTLKLWEIATGQCLQTFKGHDGYVYTVCIDQHYNYVVSGSADKTIKVWEIATGQCVGTFEGHSSVVNSACLSSDGQWVLSGSYDKDLRLWNLTTGTCLRTFKGHKGSVSSVSMSLDGQWALSGSQDDTVKLWDVTTGRCIRTFNEVKNFAPALPVCLSLDGRWGLGGTGKVAKLWRIGTVDASLSAEANGAYSEVRNPSNLRGHGINSHSPHVVPDSLQESGVRGTKETLESGTCIRTFEGHSVPINSVAISSDGKCALSGAEGGRKRDGSVRVWNLETGACLHTIKHYLGIRSVAFSPDSQHILSGCRSGCNPEFDAAVQLWKMSGGIGSMPWRILRGHHAGVNSVAFSPDGRFVLSAGGNVFFPTNDTTVRLWDWNVAGGVCLRELQGHARDVDSVAFSPDGRFALSAANWDSVILWDLASGQPLKKMDTHSVVSLAYSPDGRFALFGSTDNNIQLWDLAAGQCLQVFHGHTDTVNSVLFFPDGRFAASASKDKTIRLWDVTSGTCFHCLEGHADGVSSVVCSRDGRFVLSGSYDKTIRLWELAWKYGFPTVSDWDDGAKPHLDNFLTLHTPYASALRSNRPSEEEIALSLTRRGMPMWTEDGFKQLLYTLDCAGHGGLRPEQVRKELNKMAAKKVSAICGLSPLVT